MSLAEAGPGFLETAVHGLAPTAHTDVALRSQQQLSYSINETALDATGNAVESLYQPLLMPALPEAQPTDVGPDFLDVGQALILCAAFTCIVPAQGVSLIGRPKGVLLPMIHHDFVDRLLFARRVL